MRQGTRDSEDVRQRIIVGFVGFVAIYAGLPSQRCRVSPLGPLPRTGERAGCPVRLRGACSPLLARRTSADRHAHTHART